MIVELLALADGCRVKTDLYAAQDPTISASFVWIADEIQQIVRRQPTLLSEQFEHVITSLNYQGGVNGDENSLTVSEIRRAL